MAKKKIEILIRARDEASKSLNALAKGALAGIGIAGGLAAVALAESLGRQLTQISRQIIQIGGDFEQSMANVAAVSGATGEQLEALESKARSLGKSTVFSANEAAKAMESFALAGLYVKESMNAVGPTLNLAAAGNLSMGEAADITSSILRTFNFETEETTRIVDILAFAATNSNQTVRDMGEAMKFAGVTANILGVSLEETSSLLAVLADRGLKASIGGTGLRRSFAVFLGQLEPGEEGLRNFNAALAMNEDGSFSFAKALDQLRDSGITGHEVMKAFGDRAGVVMNALLGAGGAVREFNEGVAEAGGTAANVAAVRMDTLQGKVTLLQSALSETALVIFNDIGPRLSELTDKTIDLVTAFNASQALATYSQVLASVAEAAFRTAAGLGEILGIVAELNGAPLPEFANVWQERLFSLQTQAGETAHEIKLLEASGRSGFHFTNELLTAKENLEALQAEIDRLIDRRAVDLITLPGDEDFDSIADALERDLAAAEAALLEFAETKKRILSETNQPVGGGGPITIDPIDPANQSLDDALEGGLEGMIKAEELKRDQVRQTMATMLSAQAAIEESELKRAEKQLEILDLEFEERKEVLAGNNEALELLDEEHHARKIAILLNARDLTLEENAALVELLIEQETEEFLREQEALVEQHLSIEQLEAEHQARIQAIKDAAAARDSSREEAWAKRRAAIQKQALLGAIQDLGILFGQNKAAAIATSIINTAQGVTKALSHEDFVTAAIIAAAGALEIITIKKQKFAHGGLVTGGIPGVDSVPALLTPGEAVIPKRLVDAVLSAPVRSLGPAGFAGPGGGGGSRTINNESSASFEFSVNGEEAEPSDLPKNMRDMIEEINDVTENSGGRLVATHILINGVNVPGSRL